ncbi:2-iminobutanoate/2-iminopropanoate deaminase [Achromobacter deleyi]|uniref:2-iminobutanoate/2-iminopropanoate deaminase n=1 Tax=Achromobacter deleyi TaxID=1353891 RepID=A0A6S7B5C7_9BURK|nr:Rid family hydrolase [Achromobacter deleyi]CAB3717999.1 2-iminobutanoate/2-iminopropanoate deaminase [Achromobacter deleyi]CAB3847824.1 2-iminobutanoate/2-iminopropanoate deaminase [Achromobacter deleyi]CAB3852357.1 2-iminobutanoate/2-iminopropanoate deaminase [Achromobacter deleyi]CAB3854904.1 2-iminobutanoate/2-iminopropanoate deaminase [Achromobacter deleyi]
MDTIYTPNATPPAGHYSQAVRANGFIFVSGQLGFLPAAQPGERPQLAQGVAAQTEAALRSMAAILQAAGSSMAHVVNVTVYIPDVGLWNEVNSVYERSFGDHRPARAIVPTRELHYGALVEISAIAVAASA